MVASESIPALKRSLGDARPGAIADLNQDLIPIAELRGDAPHHSRDSEQDKCNKALELWMAVAGGVGNAGFLTRFCLAFGLIMARDDLRGQSSDMPPE